MEDIFHVHTYRCRHAENIPDEEYVLKAIKFGASSITFTDHAPFPGDPFLNRMKYAELEEYISTLEYLREKYNKQILVRIGLEIEYLPSFEDYYCELRNRGCFDTLLLGQHHYEIESGKYNFQLPKCEWKEKEYQGIMRAQIEGIKTKWFDAIAHPDRSFRRERVWTNEMATLSAELIKAAVQNQVIIEKNLQSQTRKYNFWPEFWSLVPDDAKCIIGYDAHSISQIVPIEQPEQEIIFKRGRGR